MGWLTGAYLDIIAIIATIPMPKTARLTHLARWWQATSRVVATTTPYRSTLPSKQEELWSSLGLDVTVTRREDATFAPNGYIYNVYFDGVNEDATDVPDLVASDTGCTVFNSPAETVDVTTVTQGTTAGGVLSATQLPLGDIDDSSLEAT